MRKRLIISCINILLLFIVGGCCVFAWYTNGINTTKITITNANLATEISLYKGIDFNFDGNLDLIESKDENGNIIYDDNGNVVFEDNYSLVKLDSDDEYLTLSFEDLIPTEVHTWKVFVENLGDATGYLGFYISPEIKTENLEILKFMSFRYYRILSEKEREDLIEDGYTEEQLKEIEKISDKKYLYECVKAGRIDGGYENDIVKLGSSKNFIIKFELEPYDVLIEKGYTIDKTKYQALQGTKINMNDFIIAILSSEKVEISS